MPFMGQDWRSPGEQWVRTAEGWERLRLWRLKLFENLNENVLSRLLRLAGKENFDYNQFKDNMTTHCPQPHIHIAKNTTRELKSQVSLGDVFTKLDMSGAVKDLRRFNYVCKVVDLLICHKLSNVSGMGQKYIFNTLQEILNYVVKTQTNLQLMRKLLKHLWISLEENKLCHIGSYRLWDKHKCTAIRMEQELNDLAVKQREEDGGLKLSDLPDDCIRAILHRFTDAEDIFNTGMTESRSLSLTQDEMLWRALCLFHFSDIQMCTALKPTEKLENIQWKAFYKRLHKRYGRKDTYAEMLHQCTHCDMLFWEHHGHPCLILATDDRIVPSSTAISPATLVQMIT